MSLLERLYQDLILEHSRRPRNRGALAEATTVQEGINASCGDELTLYLRVDDGVIREARFEGEGCAISQASASLMTEALRGASLERAESLSEKFKGMIRGGEADPELGDLTLLQGVADLHARVKCATLAWTTLDEALQQERGRSPS